MRDLLISKVSVKSRQELNHRLDEYLKQMMVEKQNNDDNLNFNGFENADIDEADGVGDIYRQRSPLDLDGGYFITNQKRTIPNGFRENTKTTLLEDYIMLLKQYITVLKNQKITEKNIERIKMMHAQIKIFKAILSKQYFDRLEDRDKIYNIERTVSSFGRRRRR